MASVPRDYYDALRQRLLALPKQRLVEMLEDAAKNWLAHDGLWFLAVERACGMEIAIQCDIQAWEQFSAIEARRIMERHNIPAGGGLEALQAALSYRLYAYLNVQEAIRVDERTLVFRMNDCRVQAARKRKGLPDFPCKPVGLVEYEVFARTVDPRIRTRCIACPPDPHPEEFWCAWEFTLEEPSAV
ncbi:MAG: DUF6125 family protein [Anaerolineae bacterium]|nr:DUF6125 family protein [Anaerolineae bacterium]MCX8067821.1 DUF6125 family protein [Anaerolineae bacterium]MDW7991685.1 DUF6125 family protein [Anaerolineae bacterium]